MSHDLRCTTQRMAIYESLRECKRHPTAEELFQIVRPTTCRLSLATVYNTLEALCHAGLARKLPTPLGTCRYDADVSEHVHVRMRDTSEIMDVPHELSRALLEALPRELLNEVESRLGVRIEGVNLQFAAGRPTS